MINNPIIEKFFKDFTNHKQGLVPITLVLIRVWHAGLLHKRKCCEISDQIFGLISSFLSNRWLAIVFRSRPFPNILKYRDHR